MQFWNQPFSSRQFPTETTELSANFVWAGAGARTYAVVTNPATSAAAMGVSGSAPTVAADNFIELDVPTGTDFFGLHFFGDWVSGSASGAWTLFKVEAFAAPPWVSRSELNMTLDSGNPHPPLLFSDNAPSSSNATQCAGAIDVSGTNITWPSASAFFLPNASAAAGKHAMLWFGSTPFSGGHSFLPYKRIWVVFSATPTGTPTVTYNLRLRCVAGRLAGRVG